MVRYFSELCEAFGDGWNRFWFTPSSPLPLAVIRIALGLLGLWLHLSFAPDWIRWFGPEGWLPVASIAKVEGNYASLSLWNYLTTPTQLWAGFAVGGVVLLLFTLGVFTRISSILALVVMLSDVHRAPMLAGLAEPIITMLFAYLCLAPCGAVLSWDARGNSSPPAASTSANIATRLIQIHLALFVALMGASKLMSPIWWGGTATWALAAQPYSRLSDLSSLHNHPYVFNAWTHSILAVELAFPILIWNPLARPLLLGLGYLAWWSVVLLIGQIPFGLVMMIGSLAFYSPQWLARQLGKQALGSPEPLTKGKSFATMGRG